MHRLMTTTNLGGPGYPSTYAATADSPPSNRDASGTAGRMISRVALLGLLAVAAYTKANPDAVCPNGTCSNPDFPYCDTSGVINGEPGQCIAVACTAGDFKACDGSAALTCSVSGAG